MTLSVNDSAAFIPSTLIQPAFNLLFRSRVCQVRRCRQPNSVGTYRRVFRHRSFPPVSSTSPPTPSPSPPPFDNDSEPSAFKSKLPDTKSPTTLLHQTSSFLTNLFPVWTLLASFVASRRPEWFSALTSPVIVQTSLSLLMLSTGFTLTPGDFLSAFRKPRPIIFAFFACYIIMPMIAIALSNIFTLDPTLRAGLLLLSIISGGQASNLCTHIAGGDTALSVTMTTATTLSASAILPILSSLLLGTAVPVDRRALALSTARVTLLPIALGATLNRTFPGPVRKIQSFLPVIGIAAVVICVLGPVAQCSSGISFPWRPVLLPVILLHVVGGIIGFAVPYFSQAGSSVAVTTAFETAFKSPALSFVLARRLFPPGVDVPSAISIVVLAPVAALFAVALRLARSRPYVQKSINSSDM